MTPLLFTLSLFAISCAAGLLGSLVGVGGGIIVVPALTILFGVDIKFAVGASIISVIATSSGAAATYVKDRMTNLRVAMLLELATVAGALCGAFVGKYIAGRWLFLLFSAVLAYTAASMLRRHAKSAAPVPPDPLADALRLHGSYAPSHDSPRIPYRVARTKIGLAASTLAGFISALLGIGGGTIKVPAMNLAMGVPLKVATATSNFMIGVTAAASAAIYFMNGQILPFIAAPVACGVLLGATAGAKLMGRTPLVVIRVLFVVVLAFAAGEMLWKGLK